MSGDRYSRFFARDGASTRTVPIRPPRTAISSQAALPLFFEPAWPIVAVFGWVGLVVVPETVCEKLGVPDVEVPETVCEKLVELELVSLPVDVSLADEDELVVSLADEDSLAEVDELLVSLADEDDDSLADEDDDSLADEDELVVSLAEELSLAEEDVVSLADDDSLVELDDVSQSTQKTFILSCFWVSRSPSQKSL